MYNSYSYPLKLSALLTEYLLANKRLDLPGIGTFSTSETAGEEYGNITSSRPGDTADISFENNPGIKEVPELVQFLSSRTGKMKALIAADFESHLMQARQFINIGKPFLFEGIGSLSKLKAGGFEFIAKKQKDLTSKEITNTSSTEDSFTSFGNIFSKAKTKITWKKSGLILLILASVGLAVWLGYITYRNTKSEIPQATIEKKQETIPVTDNQPAKKDSIKKNVPEIKPVHYKFILEKAIERRAFERYSRLKNYGWAIQMETADSLEYKLFLSLQIPADDTSRVIDSLTALNGRQVYIENK